MLITKVSLFSGKTHTMDLPVTQEQLDEFTNKDSRLIQHIFSELSPTQREFIISGVTPEEWDDAFKEFED